jgi:XRE family aerobic/anaerobic benzoate catabolism transcriptional regulator
MFERVLAQHDARIASAELRKEALENITRTLDARQHLYELAAVSFDTGGKTPAQIASALSALIPSAPHARFATR